MKDASETFSTQDKDFLKLQKRVEHLQQENKVLQVRAQGVQVLGIVTLLILIWKSWAYKIFGSWWSDPPPPLTFPCGWSLYTLNPNIKIQILMWYTYMFSIEGMGRICWSIN